MLLADGPWYFKITSIFKGRNSDIFPKPRFSMFQFVFVKELVKFGSVCSDWPDFRLPSLSHFTRGEVALPRVPHPPQ
jgi:hypothetical protein